MVRRRSPVRPAALIGIAALVLTAGCSTAPAIDEIPVGSDVVLETDGGATVAGLLTESSPDTVTVTDQRGIVFPFRREAVADVQVLEHAEREAAGAASVDAARRASATHPNAVAVHELPLREPAYRLVEVPAGTVLDVKLETAVGSEISHVADPVRAELRVPVLVSDVEALPAGTVLTGTVTQVERSGKVKGRAGISFQFTELILANTQNRYAVRTAYTERRARATKKKDALTIGLPAAGGAIIGAIAGGKKGAAVGSAIGGGAGTAVVLTNRGAPVRLEAGTLLSVRLTESVQVKVPVS